MWKYRNEDPDLGFRRVLTSDQAFANATGGTPAAITGLSFSVEKGKTYCFELSLLTTGVSGGGKVSISGPVGSVLSMTNTGITSGITATSTDTLTALDTLSAAYNTSAVTGFIRSIGFITAGADGTVSFNAANVTNSNSFATKSGTVLSVQTT